MVREAAGGTFLFVFAWFAGAVTGCATFLSDDFEIPPDLIAGSDADGGTDAADDSNEEESAEATSGDDTGNDVLGDGGNGG